MTWRPPSGEPQDRVWMAFPPVGHTLAATAADAHEARIAWAAVAHAIAEFEPVTWSSIRRIGDVARRYCPRTSSCVEAPLDDAWMRDIGPDVRHRRRRRARRGRLDVQRLGRAGLGDVGPRRRSARSSPRSPVPAGLRRHSSTRAAGSRSTARERCSSPRPCSSTRGATPALDARRSRGGARAHHRRDDVIWLPRGLTRDSETVRHPRPRRHRRGVARARASCCCTTQRDRSHPDHAVSAEIRASAEPATDAAGRAVRDRRGAGPGDPA